MTDHQTAYHALALQTVCDAVGRDDRESARARMKRNIERLGREIASSKAFIGQDLKLVVLPEYFLTGFPMGDPIPVWADKACLAMDGPEYDALSELAQKNGVFLAGNAYELDPHFPDLYFQTCFAIDSSGAVVLRYRRLNSMFAPTPHDVWDAYLDRYGLEGVFPVARTEIGNLAAIASEEILYPEVARCHAMRGAEVFLHPTSQANETARAPKAAAIMVRAVENMAYVVSANTAGIDNTPLPSASADGGSRIVDQRGLTLALSGPGPTMTASAEIDLAALRRHRRRPGMENLLARQRFELYAQSYASHSFYPPNTMTTGVPERKDFVKNQQAAIRRLADLNVI